MRMTTIFRGRNMTTKNLRQGNHKNRRKPGILPADMKPCLVLLLRVLDVPPSHQCVEQNPYDTTSIALPSLELLLYRNYAPLVGFYDRKRVLVHDEHVAVARNFPRLKRGVVVRVRRWGTSTHEKAKRLSFRGKSSKDKTVRKGYEEVRIWPGYTQKQFSKSFKWGQW